MEKNPMDDGQFDLTLVLVVLHHSNNHINTFYEARRITKMGGRIIVIESIYGITTDDKVANPHEEAFMRLTP